jgi:hypothetical protein
MRASLSSFSALAALLCLLMAPLLPLAETDPAETSLRLLDEPSYTSTAPPWGFAFGVTAGGEVIDPMSVCAHPSGDTIVSGGFSGGVSVGGLTDNTTSGIFFARVDRNGTASWISVGDGGGVGEAISLQMHCADDGTIFFAGSFNTQLTVNGTAYFSAGGDDALYGRLTSNGSFSWTDTISTGGDDQVTSVKWDPVNQEMVWAGGLGMGYITKHGFTLTASTTQVPIIFTTDLNGTWLEADQGTSTYGEGGFYEVVVMPNGELTACGLFAQGTVSFDGNTDTAQNVMVIVARYNRTTGWSWLATGETGMGIGCSADGYSVDVSGMFFISIQLGQHNANSVGDQDIFIARLNGNGQWTNLATAGGSGDDGAFRIGRTAGGDLLLGGYYANTASFGSIVTTGAMGTSDAFVAMLNSSTYSWEWVTVVGGNGEDTFFGVNIDRGRTLVVGISSSSSLTMGPWSHSNPSSNYFMMFGELGHDTDGDGLMDSSDSCPNGVTNWTTDPFNDHDGDGCRDSDEDLDDDDDGVLDDDDNCITGLVNWGPTNATDYDSDGCRDIDEDLDDDGDGIPDLTDFCHFSPKGWNSTAAEDLDGDGCRDSDEDDDDDGDGILDTPDACPAGATGWLSEPSSDHDGDGCKDDGEDLDDDDDQVLDDAPDWCPRGDVGWNSTPLTDIDGDGCRDDGEDGDDDGDGVADISDRCDRGFTSWISNGSNDLDGDGCRDDDEDGDDDDDGIDDLADDCPRGATGWLSWPSSDHDGDGCQDSGEDPDDDNDEVLDGDDICPVGVQTSEPDWDYDGDGCHDDVEDDDDDADGVFDYLDNCPRGEMGWTVTDHDGDGCRDETEDWDDDGDGVLDEVDSCPSGEVEWQNSQGVDNDGDGCEDSVEDLDDDNDGFLDEEDDCPTVNGNSTNDRDGCPDSDGDGWSDSDRFTPPHPIGFADAFRDDPTEWWDADDDHIGDNADPFPYDPSEWADSDNDTFGDNTDAFPEDPLEWLDGDKDGVGDNGDICANSPLGESVDEDGCTAVQARVASVSRPVVWVPALLVFLGLLLGAIFLQLKDKPEDEDEGGENVVSAVEAYLSAQPEVEEEEENKFEPYHDPGVTKELDTIHSPYGQPGADGYSQEETAEPVEPTPETIPEPTTGPPSETTTEYPAQSMTGPPPETSAEPTAGITAESAPEPASGPPLESTPSLTPEERLAEQFPVSEHQVEQPSPYIQPEVVDTPPTEVEDAAATYYQFALTQGYSPEEAVNWTRYNYPDWQG